MNANVMRTPDIASTPVTVAAGAPSVVALQPHDAERWNRFVLEHPEGTFFHRAEWMQVLKRAFGHRTHYLYAERGGQICGVLPLAEVKSALFGHSLVSTPFCVYGGILAADAEAHSALELQACSLARELNVDYLEMRNRRRSHTNWPSKDLYVTFRRPIDADPEKNMLAIPRKQRAMVRKGIQKNLTTEIDAGTDRLYAIYSESLRNLGTPVFSKRYPRILKDVFGEDCEVLTVLSGAEPVASVLSFYFRDEVLPYYGGSVLAARSVAGNDFMYWQVMDRARERGCKLFDFGRSKRDTGSFDFKTHWGFEPEPLCYEYFLVKAAKVPDLSPKNPKYERMIALWRKLPVLLTRVIGPPLARYLG
ncbi:MAG TPA: FemAB family XrtA/PEP-CTERM system-associated protein [Steroidobacteraceae bacterium]|jgi:FemAB-related protein (PEP-CTERM system-associated)|nr:FemAB family XrtA/PEP-CTERM system-associated protein [Steroidobacteraceae bacterium]